MHTWANSQKKKKIQDSVFKKCYLQAHPRTCGIEYKYVRKDRNTSFLKMRGTYDRARRLENFDHKKVIEEFT